MEESEDRMEEEEDLRWLLLFLMSVVLSTFDLACSTNSFTSIDFNDVSKPRLACSLCLKIHHFLGTAKIWTGCAVESIPNFSGVAELSNGRPL